MIKTSKYVSVFLMFVLQSSCLAQIYPFGGIPVSYPPILQPPFSTVGGATGPNQFQLTSIPIDQQVVASIPTDQQVLASIPADQQVLASIPADQQVFASIPADQQVLASIPASQQVVASIPADQQANIPSSIRTLATTFQTAIESSPILPDVFNPGQTDLHAFLHFLYKAMYTQAYKGFYNPQDLASYVNQPITEKSTLLTYPMLVNIYANTLGNVLLGDGVLNDMNAASIAYGLANQMEITAQSLIGLNYPELKFQTLTDGFISMLQSQGLYTTEKLPVVASYLAKQVNLAAGETGSKATGGSRARAYSRPEGNKKNREYMNSGWGL